VLLGFQYDIRGVHCCLLLASRHPVWVAACHRQGSGGVSLRCGIGGQRPAFSILVCGSSFHKARSPLSSIPIRFRGCWEFASIGYGYRYWRRDKWGRPQRDWKEKLAGIGLVLFGAGLVWISASTLFSDFFRPRLVLEGRVENLRMSGRRRPDHLADIAGRTVKVTTPVYDRLKFKPYVRPEVGQGSNYVFRIEYLSN
jgi:hypothetical protein